MGVLSRVLATLLALNMALMLALPIGIFAAPTPQAVQTASSWSELQAAITAAADGDTVLLTGDIQREGATGATNDLPLITKNLIIDGGNHRIDFSDRDKPTTVIDRSPLKVGAGVSLTVKNLKVSRLNVSAPVAGATTPTTIERYPLISYATSSTNSGTSEGASNTANTDNIVVNIENVSSVPDSVVGGLVSIPRGTVNFTGINSWVTNASLNAERPAGDYAGVYETVINAKTINFDGGTHTVNSAGRTIRSDATGGIDLNFTDGTTANIYARTLQAVWLQPGNVVANYAKFTATGASTVNIDGDDYGIGDEGATVTVNAGAGGYSITEGSTFTVTSWCGYDGRPFTGKAHYGRNGQPAVIQQIANGKFEVSGEGSAMKLVSYGYSNPYGATIRFRSDQFGAGLRPTFEVSEKGKVTIEKYSPQGTGGTGAAAAALRYGNWTTDAAFLVNSGGQIIVRNHAGEGEVSNSDNNAIDFGTSNWLFKLEGLESAVAITADYGPALTHTYGAGGEINVGKDTIFFAEGQTASATSGIFNVTTLTSPNYPFKFTADNPLYYNFENSRPGGGLVFNVGSNSTFSSTNSDMSFWRNGSANSGLASGSTIYNPVEGDPFRSWTGLSFTASGADFNTLGTSDDPTFNKNRDSFSNYGFTIYTRINGNNASPVFKGMETPTNADQYVRATGTIREGLPTDPPRPFFTDEVFGDISHNGSATTSNLASINKEDVYLVEQANPLFGVLRYDNGGNFLVPGDTYEITKAWRGLADPNDSKNHLVPVGGLPAAATVIDVTPPTPVTITTPTGQIWSDQKTLTGTYVTDMSSVTYNPEQIKRIYAVISDVDGSNPQPVSNADAVLNPATGTWQITLPSNLTLTQGQWISVVAEDTTGNANPVIPDPAIAAKPYHDTAFPTAPALEIKVFPIELKAKNKVIGFIDANEIKNAGGLAAINNALKALIEASADAHGVAHPYPNLNVSVINDGGFSLEVFDQTTWFGNYGDVPKTFTITYQFDPEPSYTATALVMVVPRDIAEGPVAANNFTISQVNAGKLLDATPADRNAELISRANAIGSDDVDADGWPLGGWSSANVKVKEHTIPSVKPVPQGDYTVTFEHAKYPQYTVTVTVTVRSVDPPVLEVTTPVVVWVGEPNHPNRPQNAISVWRGAAPAPTGYILASDFDYMKDVIARDKAGAGAVNITDKVTHNATTNPINFDVLGDYKITYNVSNDDGGNATAERLYIVTDDDDGRLQAHSFVVNQADANASTILTDSDASARGWSSGAQGIVAQTPNVKNTGGYGANVALGTYGITLNILETVNSPIEPEVTRGIQAVVTNKDVLNRKGKDVTGDYYAIGANNVLLRPSEIQGSSSAGPNAKKYDGTTPEAKTNLIDAAKAQGWLLKYQAFDAPIDVTVNNFPAEPDPKLTYDVTFVIEGITNTIAVTVKFRVAADPPVITFDEEPLVLPQTATSHPLSPDELRAKMTVSDHPDGNLISQTEVWYGGQQQTATNQSINQHNTGVYKVEYRVTDSDGLTTTATRAVVIQDGRYIIDKADGVILGARNFLIKKANVTGQQDEVRSLSEAEAYTIGGDNISALLSALPLPQGYVSHANEGDYPFTWKISGHTTVKPIVGKVVDATDVYNGSKESPYGVVASNFIRDTTDAAAIVADPNTRDSKLIEAAQAKAYKLIGNDFVVPGVVVRVVEWGTPPFAAAEGTYNNITFGVTVDLVPLAAPPTQARVSATVGTDPGPILTVTTPYELIVNAPFDPRDGVTAIDDKDGDLINAVKYNSWSYPGWTDIDNPVDTATVGLYSMKYWVTDSGGSRASAGRLVIVNDDTYTPGDGRVLYGRAFVVKATEVTPNPSVRGAEIISNSKATLFDGTAANPGANLGSSGITVPNTNNYGPAVGTYYPTLSALGVSGQPITRTIGARVVDADVIGPTTPPATGPVTYVYGKNLDLRIAEAQVIETSGDLVVGKQYAPNQPNALSAYAVLAQPNGVLVDTNAKVISIVDAATGLPTTFQAVEKDYLVTVSDVNEVTSIVLSVRVSPWKKPVVKADPKPLVYNVQNTTAPLSKAQLLKDVTAQDDEDGDLLAQDKVNIEIKDENGNTVSSVPQNKGALYQVIYSVVDSDGNPAQDQRALIIDDGRYTWDDAYILSARSFIIGESQVATGNEANQIRDFSGAKAWTTSGSPAVAEVYETAGYRDAKGSYAPGIRVAGHPAVSRLIAAKVFYDADEVGGSTGTNGDRYAIQATHFYINHIDAIALAARPDSDPAYFATFISRVSGTSADATSYDRASSSLDHLGTVQVASDGGFRNYVNLPGDQIVTVTFRVAEEPSTTTTIKVYISNRELPVLTVPDWRSVDVGANLNDTFYRAGVSAVDTEDGDLTDKVGYNASAVDTSKVGSYTVTYSVTDSDHNTVEKTSLVFVGLKPIGDYLVAAYDFVQSAGNLQGTDAEILSSSHTKVWRIVTSAQGAELVAVDDSRRTVLSKVGYSSTAQAGATIAIRLGVNPEPGYQFPDTPQLWVNAHIVAQSSNVSGPGPAAKPTPLEFPPYYTVAALNKTFVEFSERNDYVGTGTVAKAKLIAAAQAVAYKAEAQRIDNTNPNFNPFESYDVDVKSNGFPANPVNGGLYEVVFVPKGITGVELKVIFEVNGGDYPVITFTEDPLVIQQGAPGNLTADELKAKMIVTDKEDGNLINETSAIPVAGTINRHSIGIYRVNYSVTDAQQQTTTASRLVVITDGRYDIIDEDGDGTNDIIIGARSFVIERAKITGGADQVRNESYAEAYDNKTYAPLIVRLVGEPFNWAPAGWNSTKNPNDPTTYSFSLYAEGHANKVKNITGTASGADVVVPGGKDSQYALTANHFQVNTQQAYDLIVGGHPAFIAKANAQVVPLVPTAPALTPAVLSLGGFAPAEAVYPITFGASDLTAIVNGTVTDGNAPVITAPTPLEVWVGDASKKPAGAILASAYSDTYGVTVTDAEDDAAGLPIAILVSGDTVNPNKVGTYKLQYDAVDSDGNHPLGGLVSRVVVVNDGRYTIGKGRILLANGFVVKAADVETNKAGGYTRQQILSKSDATLFDAVTGDNLGSIQVDVANYGGYGDIPVVDGEKQITLRAPDLPSGTIERTITAKIVDAAVVEPPATGDPTTSTTYVYGNNIDVRPSVAKDLLDQGEAAILAALGAGAAIAEADGTLSAVGVKIVSSTLDSSAVVNNLVKVGRYTVVVGDVNNKTTATLTINVYNGTLPVITAASPLVVQWVEGDSSNLTRAEFLNGTYLPQDNKPWAVTADDQEDGDLTGSIEITDPATGSFPQIPHNVVGVYQVLFTVFDSDGGSDQKIRALVVDDGNTVYDDKYILQAASFLIPNSEVDVVNSNAQILDRSKAKAWTTEGVDIKPYVIENGGYTKQADDFTGPKDYSPLIGVSGYAQITKQITARIYNDGTSGGDNGAIYSLLAKDFRINITEAIALQAQAGTASYEQAFITKSGATSFLRNTVNLALGGTPRVARTASGALEDGGFATASFAQPGDANYPTRVPITIWVDEEQSTAVTINAIVSNGGYPTITVPAPKVVALNAPFGEAEYMAGVTAIDSEDGDLTGKITHDNPVDTSKEGLYFVTYSVTDSENNTSTAVGLVSVNLPVNGDYVIKAYSFVKIADEVTTNSALIDPEIIKASNATAIRWRDVNGAVVNIDVSNRLIVTDRGGYSNVPGDYKIKLDIDPEPGFATDHPVEISGKVIDRDVIDSGPGVGNDSSRYVVAANNSLIRYSEVSSFVGLDDAVKTRLKNRAEAVAFKLVRDANGVYPPENYAVDVVANDIAAGATAGAVFSVTFIAAGVPDVSVTVEFKVVEGAGPVFNPIAPLKVPWTEASQILTDTQLLDGVTATDLEDDKAGLPLAITVVGSPAIDSSAVGIYQVEYKAVDSDGNWATTTRAVIVDDGRYVIIPGVDETVILGAKNYVVRQSDVATGAAPALAQAKDLSFVEAFNDKGQNIINRVELVGGLPTGYLNKEIAKYPLTWKIAVPSAPQDALKPITAEILDDGFKITPPDKNAQYAIIAKDFSVKGSEATALVAGGNDALIARAEARIIKLVDSAPDRKLLLLDNGGFKAEKGTYPITFGAEGIDQAKLSLVIEGRVTSGTSEPTLAVEVPIKIPIAAPGTANIDAELIKAVGKVVAIDSDAVDPVSNPAGDITEYVQVIDTATGNAPAIPADQPGVYSIAITIVDSDGNTVSKRVAVVVDDGNFVYTQPKADGSGHILRAHGFNIDLRDVNAPGAVEQIRSEGEVQAWLNDGTQISASVISTGGYSNAAGTYRPVVGIYNNPGSAALTVLEKTITVNVIDTYPRRQVTFDANGGTLVGPRTIIVVEPQRTLSYLPASPVREGYTFRYWATTPAGGTQFTVDTQLTGDITVYAIWEAVPPPYTIVTPPPNVIINNPPGNAGTTYVTVTPAAQQQREETTIEPTQTPEAAGTTPVSEVKPPLGEAKTGWSLLNLLATILALALFVVFFIKFFYDRPRDEDYEEEPIDVQVWEAMSPEQRAQYQARREADYQAWAAEQRKRSTGPKALFVNAPVLLIVAVALVEAIVVLVLTQNFSLSWTAVDNYSVIFALIVFVQLLAPMVAAIIRNGRLDKSGPLRPSQSTPGSGGATL